jgi:phosphate-selective porin OprO/OprP
MRSLAIVLILLGTAWAQPGPPGSEPAPEDEALLRREIDELRMRQRDLERRLDERDLRPHVPEAAPANSPSYRFGRDGFAIGTPDGKTEIRFRAVVHMDGRAYLGGTQPIPDTFLIRRARPFIEGTVFGIIDFRLMPDFGQGQSWIQDAYIELHPWRWLRLRAGRFRSPMGLEWLQSDSTIVLLERSLATDLVPYRDLGVMLTGDIAGETFSYALAMFNGAPDGANGPDLDPQSEKDYVGRVFFHPLAPLRRANWTKLGLGVAASYGQLPPGSAGNNLPTYHSTGQQPIFNYITGAVTPDDAVKAGGDRWRVAPQMYWYLGPVGIMAEYVYSSQRVQRQGAVADIANRAWNLTASFVMTLERASYEGVVPRRPVDFHSRNLGAFELAIRYSELRLDASAFPVFADPSQSVRTARELAGGINWYLTEHTRVMISFHRTDFVGGAPLGGDREPENALMARLQLAL